MSSRQKRWLVLTVVAAAALRLWCFIGYARGDDPLYVTCVAQGKIDQLASLPAGYVVAGGSQVHYALVSSVLQLDDGMIPRGWRLVRELPNTPAPYRPQPLRIWEIGASGGGSGDGTPGS